MDASSSSSPDWTSSSAGSPPAASPSAASSPAGSPSESPAPACSTRGSPFASVAATAGAVASAALTVVLARLVLSVVDGLDGQGLATLLMAVSAGGCALVAARLALCLVATAVASALPGRGRRRGARVALALSPRGARPVVALLLSAGLATGAGTAAAAHPTVATSTREPGPPGASGDGRGGAPAVLLPDPAWRALPEPGGQPPPPPPAPLLPPADAALVTSGGGRGEAASARAAHTADDLVVVRRGDSLWRIAARHLGSGATDAEVAAEWPKWWHANLAVVGADPDLLLPGTRLRPPELRPDAEHTDTEHFHADHPDTDRTRHDVPHTQRDGTHEPKELR